MEIKNVDNEIISSLRKGLAERIKRFAKEPFDGKTIQTVEKEFLETVGESGAAGLTELFIRNAEPEKRIIENDETHYRKFISTGKYLTLLGEVSLRRGIYQSNNQKKSICPLEEKLNFINNYVSFAAAEYICYSMASMTLPNFRSGAWQRMRLPQGQVTSTLLRPALKPNLVLFRCGLTLFKRATSDLRSGITSPVQPRSFCALPVGR